MHFVRKEVYMGYLQIIGKFQTYFGQNTEIEFFNFEPNLPPSTIKTEKLIENAVFF